MSSREVLCQNMSSLVAITMQFFERIPKIKIAMSSQNSPKDGHVHG